MRPTRAGLGLLVIGVGLALAGRLLGILELYLLAAMAIVALVLAAIYTASTRLDLSISRVATPARLRAGTPARIDLTLRNRGGRGTPVLSAHDQVQGGRGASVLLAPLGVRKEARIAYRLPTNRRGRLRIGPLDLSLGDPLGLTRSRIRAAEVTDLMVHPRLIELMPLIAIAGHDPTADQQPIRAIANSGDEFFALRPYVFGDELKRVNWRASARLDDLVVRQEERPKTGRVTVLLDRRAEVYDDEGFERAVSAALSALHSGFRGGDALRFLTSSGPAVSDIRTRSELDAVDEQLALIDTTQSASLIRSLEELNRISRGGTLVVVTGLLQESVEPVVARARRTFGLVVVIACVRSPDGPWTWAITYDGATDLASEWRLAVTSTKGTSER
ncbi:MAG: DUF58 domain-containing protein [Acidimicrobiales bacterium]